MRHKYPFKANLSLRQSGVSMIEFAIVAPFAFLFILILIQFGFVYMAKLNLNHATFMAARSAAMADGPEAGTVAAIKASVQKGLIPFYQNSLIADSSTRIGAALVAAKAETLLPPNPFGKGFLEVTRLSPPADAFKKSGFGLVDKSGKRYIPNDNLEWRSKTVRGNMTIQDANLLKIKVKYGYHLKLPLMETLIKNIMCGVGEGIDIVGADVTAFGALDSGLGAGENCRNYYRHGRIPIVSFATVHMQSNIYE
jgi:hypothetical protein